MLRAIVADNITQLVIQVKSDTRNEGTARFQKSNSVN